MAKLNKINLNGTEILLEQLSKYINILEPDENGNLDIKNIPNHTWTLIPVGGMLGGYDSNGNFVTNGCSFYNANGSDATQERLNTIRIVDVSRYSNNIYVKMIWFAPSAGTWDRNGIASGIMYGVAGPSSYSDTSLPSLTYSGLLDHNSLRKNELNITGLWTFSNSGSIPRLSNNTTPLTPTDARHIVNKAYVDLGDLLNSSNNTYILNTGIRYDMGLTYTDETTIAKAQEIMDDYYPKFRADSNQAAMIFAKDYTMASNGVDLILRGNGKDFYYTYPERPAGLATDPYGRRGHLHIEGSWDDTEQKFTVSSVASVLDSYTPTQSWNTANKGYVDNQIAASKTLPTITIAASQIVSADPVIIAMTTEQQGILEDSNQPYVLIDGTVLGLSPAYSYKAYDASNKIYITGYSLGTNEDQSGNLYAERIGTILAVYDKTTKQMKATDADPCCDRTPVRGTDLTNKNYVDASAEAVRDDIGILAIRADDINLESNAFSIDIESGPVFDWFKNNPNTFISLLLTSNYKSILILNANTSEGANHLGLFLGSYNDVLKIRQMRVEKTFTDNVLTKIRIGPGSYSYSGFRTVAFTDEILSKTNVSAYTPTQQYHPATKGYVDTAIAASGGGGGLPSLTLSDTVFELVGDTESAEMETTDVEAIFAFANELNVGDEGNKQIILNVTDQNNMARQFLAILHRTITDTQAADTDAITINCYDNAAMLFTIYASVTTEEGKEDVVFGAYDSLWLADSITINDMMEEINNQMSANAYEKVGIESFTPLNTYDEGDYVYNGDDMLIYKCNTDNTTGDFDPTYWDEVSYMDYMREQLIGNALGGSY